MADHLRSAASLERWASRTGSVLGQTGDAKVDGTARRLGLIPPELKWVDEPPPGAPAAGSFTRHWQPVVDELREHRGRWASLGEQPRHVARSLARVFRDIETTTRPRRGGRVDLYARAR